MKNKQIKLLVERYPVLKAIENEVFNACRMCGAAVPQAPVLTAPALSAGSSITVATGGALDAQRPMVCAGSAAMFLLRMRSPAT